MSKRHYPWWNYVKYIVQKYPEQRETPGEEMSNVERANWCAVDGAIESTEKMKDGLGRMKIIQMVHWGRKHTLEGAALSIPCDRATAARWQKRFFEEVARNRGLMD